MKAKTSDKPATPGAIIHRVIRGKDRFYHQWRENGQTKSRYLKPEEVEPLRRQIEQRKKGTDPQTGTDPLAPTGSVPFSACERLMRQALTGARLLEFAYGVRRFKRRTAFGAIKDFLADRSGPEVLLVNGPAGSGKTTLIRQILLDFTAAERNRTVYLRPLESDSEEDIAAVLTRFAERGIRMVFIDGTEFTSDYGLSGIKIVLTTELPLPALYGGEEPIITRFSVLDLSFIPYSEHVTLFGDTPLETYIESGGTLANQGGQSPSGQGGQSPLVARGLSLPLQQELTGAEDRLNTLFLLEILTSAAAKPRESRRRQESFVGTDIGRLAKRLAAEIGDPTENDIRLREILLTVPSGVRFRHLRTRVLSLLDDPVAAHLGAAERELVLATILSEARERLFEDIVWHELSAFRTTERSSVERIRFAPGAYGFVIADRKELTCELVTATLASTRDERQLRYLNDPLHLERIEHRYGIITSREAIYLGRNARHGTGVVYRNASDYLIQSRMRTVGPAPE